MHYLEALNESQRKAVEHSEGPVMIIAGAGSGKTRVLTYRIVHKIKQGADPFHILALTFTNKAAREMKSRIIAAAGPESSQVWMGTFHSVFARILRLESKRINYPSNFTIYDTDDSKNLLKDIIRGKGLDEKTYKPDIILHRISTAKTNLISYQEYQQNPDFQNEDTYSGRPHTGRIYETYCIKCYKAGAMDFDDLLYKTYDLLKESPEALTKYQGKFQYILVDEFQDTNFLQYAILKKLAARNENISVVGDDAQSIYSFRGATIKNILNFSMDYPDLAVFKLEQNYRSTGIIVKAANNIISRNKDQIDKSVWTENADGEKIKLLRALTDNEEGNQVAKSIFDLKNREGFSNRDFAILYRTNAQSRSMEEALRRFNIPYRIYGGLSFYKRKEIKDILAYFRLAINPSDEEALKRIINYPARGIGKTTLEKLMVIADEQNLNLWQIIENIFPYSGITGGASAKRISEFCTMIKSFAGVARQQDAYQAASHIASASGVLKEFYSDHTPEGISRYENIQELLNGIKEFVEKSSGTVIANPEDGEILVESQAKTLDIFMQDIALLTDADEDTGENDTVSLMTIHASKGLEFPNVFIVGMEENLFPSYMSAASREDMEEERRLFYVAVTRAQKRLVLSYAKSRYRWGNLTDCEPSRFLEDIDRNFIEPVPGHTRPSQYEEPVFRNSPRVTNNFPLKKNIPAETKVPVNLKAVSKVQHTGGAGFSDDLSKIQVGMSVEHMKFGSGKVINLDGPFPDIKATILFHQHGQKQLLLRFAKLKIVQ